MNTDLLNTIIELSHEFGTADYVKGGGGNTSVKNDQTLLVKPSGTTLEGLTPELMVAMNREKIDVLYSTEMPTETNAREECVKDLMEAAVENDAGRPSVEAPLHNVFAARYVVHTHPALVNGLTCAVRGEEVCRKLFPEALWVEYIDPGYTLCMVVRDRIERFKKDFDREPQLLFLQNHGIFISADTAEDVRALYQNVMETLRGEYEQADVPTSLEIATVDIPEDTAATIRDLLGEDAAGIAAATGFKPAPGPISPDHLVYARAFPYQGDLTREGLNGYIEKYGYTPKVLQIAENVYGLGTTQKKGELALEFAWDSALVLQLSAAFGGIHYMSDAHRRFIENWEVESYRASQS